MPVNKKPLYYGSLKLKSRYLISPLAGFTNLSFRRVVRGLGGVGLATTDLVNAKGLLAGSQKTLRLIETTADDSPFAVQIFGSDTSSMIEAARFLEERDVDSIDINMGCPVQRITKGGAGAGMMNSTDATISLVKQVVNSVKIPVTVKMRLGWDHEHITAPFFASEFEKVGVAAIAIHGRTREQGFSGVVDLDGIKKVVEAIKNIPVIGNGDIRTVEDADRMFNHTGCHGISIGRGALANPWIFRQLVEWEETGKYNPPGNFEERLQLLKLQFQYLLETHDSKSAIIIFRKTAHWYLKSMRVRAALRHQLQQAKTEQEFELALNSIDKAGPLAGTRTGVLPDMHIPVPSGPVERW